MASLVFHTEAMGGMDEVRLPYLDRKVLEPSWACQVEAELASESELWLGLRLLLPFVLVAWPWRWLV